MKRREFIALLGGVVASWPSAARAQQPAVPVVGFLGTTTPDDFADRVAAFREGLKEVGYVEGQNVVIEYRWPEGHYDRLLPTLVSDLVRRQVAVIAAVGGEPSALAAKAATSTIPIVFAGGDPVKSGLTTSINRPGGNVTGIVIPTEEMGPKRLGLLREVVPQASAIGFLLDSGFPFAEKQLSDMREAAHAMNLPIVVFARTY